VRRLAALGRTDEANTVFETVTEGTTEALCYAAEYFAQHGRKDDARALIDRINARKRTMPAYQKRRERPWLRRAASLNRRLLMRTG